jgi:threonine/homoserine/homoserine lactone efflux protein
VPLVDVLPAFLISVTAIVVAPGPDMAFIVACAIDGGPRSGVLAALGMSAGMLIHTVLAALGLATLLQGVPASVDVIRLLGAAYLAYLAADTLRGTRSAGLRGYRVRPPGAVFRRAAITNLANPKIVVFFAAFLPQFTRPEAGSVGLQLLLLGLLFLLIALAVDVMVGLTAGQLRQLLADGRPLAVVLSMASAVVFATIAVLLVVDTVR